MFIITGANGQLGHAIVKKILGFVSADQVAAICRDPQKAADLSALGVEVRPGDFDKPESLSRAFEGASQVLIVSSNARAYGGDPLVQHQNAIDAARAAGAARIVYTSHMAASAHSAFPPMHDHAATEKMLQDCGVVWTALRHGFYASSAIAVIRDALETGVILPRRSRLILRGLPVLHRIFWANRSITRLLPMMICGQSWPGAASRHMSPILYLAVTLPRAMVNSPPLTRR